MQALAGCRIVYTRAARHWPNFAATVRALGAEAWHLPLLDTAPLPLDLAAERALQEADFCLFPSANAAEYLLCRYALPPACVPVAIGEKTRAAVARFCPARAIVCAPPPFNSEALWQVWQPRGKKIVLVSAPAGRKWLFTKLSAENTTKEVVAYQCFNPSTMYPKDFLTADVVTIASQKTLSNLIAIIPQCQLKLLQYQACIAALSAAVAAYATRCGFQKVVFAESATESSQINAICQWWHNNKELFFYDRQH